MKALFLQLLHLMHICAFVLLLLYCTPVRWAVAAFMTKTSALVMSVQPSYAEWVIVLLVTLALPFLRAYLRDKGE